MTELPLPGALQATFWPGGRVPSDGHMAFWGVGDLPDALAALELPPGASAALPTVLPRTPRARTRVTAADVPARVLPMQEAVRGLAALADPTETPAWRRPADSVLAWSVAAKLALEGVARSGVPHRSDAPGHRTQAGHRRDRRGAHRGPVERQACFGRRGGRYRGVGRALDRCARGPRRGLCQPAARGRTYARKGTVADLAIGPGEVTARVAGSRPAPYSG